MQSQFLEDVVHVALHSVRREVKAPRDFLVAQAFHYKADDFPFTSSHPYRSYSLTSCDRPLRDLREKRPRQGFWEYRRAVCHSVDCANEVRQCGILQNEARNTNLYVLDQVLLNGKEVHEDHSCAGRGLPDGFYHM